MPTPVSPPAGRPALAHPAYELFAAALSLLAIVNVVLYLLIPDPALDTILAVMNGLFSVIFLLDFLYRARHAESFGTYFVRGFGWAESRLATRRTGRLAGRRPRPHPSAAAAARPVAGHGDRVAGAASGGVGRHWARVRVASVPWKREGLDELDQRRVSTSSTTEVSTSSTNRGPDELDR